MDWIHLAQDREQELVGQLLEKQQSWYATPMFFNQWDASHCPLRYDTV
jgi:hypothetical protein